MKIKIAAILLVTLILCSGCGFQPVMQDGSSASQESKIETKQFVSPGIGIQLMYDPKWIVNDNPLKPEIQLLYGVDSKITISLLQETFHLKEFTLSFMKNLFQDYFSDDYTKVNKMSNYIYEQDSEKLYVGLNGEYQYHPFLNNAIDMSETISKKESWYFITLDEKYTYFIRYEEGGNCDYSQEAEDMVKSIVHFSNPSLNQGAISFEEFITQYYSKPSPFLDLYEQE